MSAFNKRIQPFEIGPVPGACVVGLVFALLGGLLFFLMPTPLNLFFGVVFIVSLATAILALLLGDEFFWLFQKWVNLLEKRTPTQFGRD